MYNRYIINLCATVIKINETYTALFDEINAYI